MRPKPPERQETTLPVQGHRVCEPNQTQNGQGQGSTRVIDSEALLLQEGSVWIRHQGALYRLQHTRQGKLILTK